MRFIFGYGSLVKPSNKEFFVKLKGYRRTWNIAMDNSVTLPNYKYYINSKTGVREAIYVCFLNIEEDPKKEILGVLIPVDEQKLKKLDLRERNYKRVDITSYFMHLKKNEIVETYIGTKEAKERFLNGLYNQNVFASKNYYDQVCNSFAQIGEKPLADYLYSFNDKPILKKLTIKR